MDRVAPVFGGKTRAVRAPKNLLVVVNACSRMQRLEDGAFFPWVGCAVGTRVVGYLMHVSPQEPFRLSKAEHPRAGRIAECAAAVGINAVDGLRRGIQQRADFLLAFP